MYTIVVMGTLGGFPNPPAMVRAELSSAAPHAIVMGTLGGFPNPPALWRSRKVAAAGREGKGVEVEVRSADEVGEQSSAAPTRS